MPKAERGTALNRARAAAHDAFDRIWRKQGLLSREAAYRWLALRLGLPKRQAHIGKFDVDRCRNVVEICRSFDLTDPHAMQAIREAREQNAKTVKEYHRARRRSVKP